MHVAGNMSARSYTIRYIMTRRALLCLTSSGVHHLHNTVGPSVITRGETNNSALDCLDLADTLILSWAPVCKCAFQRWSHKCGVALVFDVCWPTTDVSAWEGQGVVCLLSHFINVNVQAKGFIWMFKPRYLAELPLFSACPWMVKLDCSGVLVAICRTLHLFGCSYISHWSSHFCNVSRSCCRVRRSSSDLILRSRLITYGFASRSACMETSPLPMEGCKI